MINKLILDTGKSENGKRRIDIDIFKQQTLQAQDRVYSRIFTGSFSDPDGAIRTEGFAFTYQDVDEYAHRPRRQMHVLLPIPAAECALAILAYLPHFNF